MSLDDITARVDAFGIPLVEITGGEPLLQRSTPSLMQALLRRGHQVLLETNGSLDISAVPPAVHVVLDLKAPGSGVCEQVHWDNLHHLRTGEIKIVLADREDYEWARQLITGRLSRVPFPVLLSPVADLLPPADLARWMVEDHLPARLQLQLHKVIWPPQMRGV